jgi:hypothetical protein
MLRSKDKKWPILARDCIKTNRKFQHFMAEYYKKNQADFHGSAFCSICKYQQNWLKIVIWIDFYTVAHQRDIIASFLKFRKIVRASAEISGKLNLNFQCNLKSFRLFKNYFAVQYRGWARYKWFARSSLLHTLSLPI